MARILFMHVMTLEYLSTVPQNVPHSGWLYMRYMRKSAASYPNPLEIGSYMLYMDEDMAF